MILILLAFVCLAAAEPEPGPGVYVVDGVEGLIYEFPEYEDPDMAMFQLSAMGAMPVLTILEAAKESEDSRKQGDSTYYEQLAEVKRGLDDVIARLHLARTKLQNGNTRIFMEVDKSINNLKKMERHLRSDVHSFGTSMRQSLSFTSNGNGNDFITDGEVTFSTQTPISAENSEFEDFHEEKTMKTPFGDSILITEAKKYGDGEKAALRKKWTWKSAGDA